jgi:hypothetical protein
MAARATTAWQQNRNAGMAGTAVVYSRTGSVRNGDAAYTLINPSLLAFSQGVHAEDYLLPRVNNLLNGATRVAIYTYYSPCKKCSKDLLALPARHPGIQWRLGYCRLYSTTQVQSGSERWPNDEAALAAVHDLILVGWVVKTYGNPASGRSSSRVADTQGFQDVLRSLDL